MQIVLVMRTNTAGSLTVYWVIRDLVVEILPTNRTIWFELLVASSYYAVPVQYSTSSGYVMADTDKQED